MQADPFLDHIISALPAVEGIEAIVLGGSRGRGTATDASDYDIGLYYSASRPLDTRQLQDVARTLVDDPDRAEVTAVGGWGPWIVGGAWLSIGHRKVDLLYRNIDAVAQVIEDGRAGKIGMHYQPGHPHGFCSAIWIGEVALCEPLYDPQRAIAKLKAATLPYPPRLRQQLIDRFQWEILFSIENAALAISRREQSHVAGCAYRALSCVGQVLFAVNERYLINEKGALAEAAGLPLTIPALTPRVAEMWRLIGEQQLGAALTLLRELEGELKVLTSRQLA